MPLLKPGLILPVITSLLIAKSSSAWAEEVIRIETEGGADHYTLLAMVILIVMLLAVAAAFFLYRMNVNKHSLDIDDHLSHQMIEMATDGIFAVDQDGICILCNPAAVELLGYESELDLIGKHMHSLMHHSHKDGSQYHAHDCKVYNAIQRGSSIHVDDEVFWKADGTSLDVDYKTIPLRDGGKIIGSVVNFKPYDTFNIDHSIKSASVDYTPVILEKSPMAIAITRLNGEFIYKNEKYIQWFGPSMEKEGTGQGVSFYVTPEDRTKLASTVEDKGFVQDVEIQMRRRDGKVVWTSTSWEYIDYEGETAKIIFLADITEQKEAENRLLNAIENIPEGFAFYDKDNRLVLCNQKFKELYGFVDGDVEKHPSFEELLEKDVALGYVQNQIIGGEDYGTRRAAYRNYCIGEFDLKLADGRSITIRERRGANGEIYCIHADVTKLKRAEERFKDAIENISDGFVIYDEAGLLIMCNSHFRKFYNYSDYEARPGIHYQDLGRLDTEREIIVVPPGETKEEYLIRRREYRQKLDGEFIVHLNDGRILLTRDRRTAEGGIVSIQTDITKRYATEQELKAAEKRFSDIANATSDWFWETDNQFRLTKSSDRFYELLEVEKQEVLGKTRRELYDVRLPGNSSDKILAHIACLEKQEPFKDFQYAIKTRKGKIKYITVSGVPFFDEKGEFIGYRGAARDRTRLAEAEQSLEQSRTMFQSILDASPFAIIITRMNDDRILYLNRKAAEQAGLNEHEMLGRPINTYLLDKKGRENIVRQVRADGRIDHYELQLLDQHERPYWAEGMSSMMLFNGEKVILSMFHDISARKKVEQAMRDKLAFEKSLFQTIPSPIFYKDKEGRYQGGNKAFEDYIGIKIKDLIGKTVYDIAPQDKAEIYEKADNALLEKPELQIYEAPVRYADGSDRIVKFYKAVFFDSQGEPAGIVGNMADITENKRLVEELQSKENRIREVLRVAPVPILISRPEDGSIVFFNEGAGRLFGMSEAVMDSYRAKNFYVDPLKRDEFVKELETSGEVRHFEAEFQSTTGRRFWGLMSATVISFQGETVILVSFVDISSRKEMEENLRAMTVTDPYTGAANRRHFFEKAEEEIKRANRYEKPLSLMLIDADNFKAINNEHGHDIGDKTLRILSDICLSHLRSSDVFGRLGGEEFAFVLPETDADGAIAFAERIRTAVEQEKIKGRKGEIKLTITVGIASHSGKDGHIETLIKQAEDSLHEAKKEGGNRVFHTK